MNMRKSIALMEKYVYCLECGSDLINNGEGTLIIDENSFIRTCKCGWKVEVVEGEEIEG